MRGAPILRANAVFHLAVGVVLVLSTWDGFYNSVDLPKANPALGAQLGGVALIAFAYLLWLAPTVSVLTTYVARAAVLANLAAALIILAWLVFRGKTDLYIGNAGIVELAVVAAVFGVLAVAEAPLARGSGA